MARLHTALRPAGQGSQHCETGGPQEGLSRHTGPPGQSGRGRRNHEGPGLPAQGLLAPVWRTREHIQPPGRGLRPALASPSWQQGWSVSGERGPRGPGWCLPPAAGAGDAGAAVPGCRDPHLPPGTGTLPFCLEPGLPRGRAHQAWGPWLPCGLGSSRRGGPAAALAKGLLPVSKLWAPRGSGGQASPGGSAPGAPCLPSLGLPRGTSTALLPLLREEAGSGRVGWRQGELSGKGRPSL